MPYTCFKQWLSFLDVFRDTKLNEFRIFSDPSFTVVSITKLETEGPVWWTQNTWIVHTNRTVTPVTRCSPLLIFLVYVSIFFLFSKQMNSSTHKQDCHSSHKIQPLPLYYLFCGQLLFLSYPIFLIWIITLFGSFLMESVCGEHSKELQSPKEALCHQINHLILIHFIKI